MIKIIERNVAEIIILGIFLIILLSSCGSTNKVKKCCQKTAQEVYEYEGLIVN